VLLQFQVAITAFYCFRAFPTITRIFTGGYVYLQVVEQFQVAITDGYHRSELLKLLSKSQVTVTAGYHPLDFYQPLTFKLLMDSTLTTFTEFAGAVAITGGYYSCLPCFGGFPTITGKIRSK